MNRETFPLPQPERFPHLFVGRVAGVDVLADREEALRRLSAHHDEVRRETGLADMPLATAQQVHGNRVAAVDLDSTFPVEGVDGLVTATPGLCLGIYVADCGAVYAVDPVAGCIGLAHSGKKGTEQMIAVEMLRTMTEAFGSDPAQVSVALGPCIRPPHYEVDFAAEIIRQCREAGVKEVVDSGVCTASSPDRYYSYRREKGRTGRMLALLAMRF